MPRVQKKRSIYQVTPQVTSETVNNETAQLKSDNKRIRPDQFVSLAEKIAMSGLYKTNWYYPGGAEAFPNRDEMQFVDKYFPNAQGGPLLVDEPNFDDEFAPCEEKSKKLLAMGYRYVIIGPHDEYLELIERVERMKQNVMDHSRVGPKKEAQRRADGQA